VQSPCTGLRPKPEHFAQHFAANGNATAAYRAAFECSGMLPATVRQRAYELAHDPIVAARVRELLAVAAEGTTISARARMVRLQDIAEADPSELVRVIAEPCRYCHGAAHRYQWRDADEYALACARELDEAVEQRRAPKLLSDAGGYGYTHAAEPHAACPECRGDGVTRVSVTPTDQLSPAARRLLKGVRQKASGEITVLLHDQLAASDQLNKMQGVYVDRSVSLNVSATVPELRDMTHEQALDFLESIKPTRPASAAPVTIGGETA
jgi:phage terminase small subunit